MRPVLSVQNLDVHFGDRPILRDINFDILPRQVFVLMGPGGAGKSTIVRTLCMLNVAQQNAEFSGQILYQDRPITPDHAPRMVVQKARMLLGTILENLREQFPRRSQLTPLEIRQELAKYLQSIHLGELAEQLDTEVLDLTKVQRKKIMIAGLLLDDPALICLDEPTVDLDDAEVDEFLQFLRFIAQSRAIIIVTHNQRHARAIGDVICLVAGGRIQECRPTEQFFTSPQSQPARDYVRTGGCSVPSLTAKPEDLEPDYSLLELQVDQESLSSQSASLPDIETTTFHDGPTTEPGLVTDSTASTTRAMPFGWLRTNTRHTPIHELRPLTTQHDEENTSDTDVLAALKALYIDEDSDIFDGLSDRTTPEAVAYVSENRGPRNFRWLRQGQLAGTPQPGLLVDIDQDFQALKRVGVTHLITLTEEPLQNAPLEKFNIRNIHFPIVDMQAPTIEDSARLCTIVANLLSKNATIAYHCRAGIGRTGTMLVAQLIWEGMDDQAALETARNIYRAWVQSEEQEAFLTQFYQWVRTQKPANQQRVPSLKL